MHLTSIHLATGKVSASHHRGMNERSKEGAKIVAILFENVGRRSVVLQWNGETITVKWSQNGSNYLDSGNQILHHQTPDMFHGTSVGTGQSFLLQRCRQSFAYRLQPFQQERSLNLWTHFA